jgi:hypothetical protein
MAEPLAGGKRLIVVTGADYGADAARALFRGRLSATGRCELLCLVHRQMAAQHRDRFLKEGKGDFHCTAVRESGPHRH